VVGILPDLCRSSEFEGIYIMIIFIKGDNLQAGRSKIIYQIYFIFHFPEMASNLSQERISSFKERF
jgi:hypothetical protein